MSYAINLRNILLVVFASLLLTACATQKKAAKESSVSGLIQSDVYTGTDTVEFLATGVQDRVFSVPKLSVSCKIVVRINIYKFS